MKRKIFSFLILLTCFLAGCDDDSTMGVSNVTTYPTLTMAGLPVIAHPAGTPYTEQGVTAMAGEESLEVEIDGSVDDVNTVGNIYYLTYTAYNAEGYSRSLSRAVVIVDPATGATDLSGTYLRAATGIIGQVTKIAPSLYFHSNVGGALPPTPPLDAYFVHIQGTTLKIPLQISPNAGITVESITASTNASGLQWTIRASGYGAATNRVWAKQ